MYQLRQTALFPAWLAGLRDTKAQARILVRLESARLGNLGDTKSVGGGVREMRIHVGPGYRVYFARPRGGTIVLLCGGDKSTQDRDIANAKRLLTALTGS
ncbi:MAG: type II toxin-antitoxin system RelE/ParE family toxin [bacterium]